MANRKITQLPDAAVLTGAELLEGVQSAASVKLTTAAVAALAPLPPSNRLIPAGGTTGQALAKVDDTDYNVSWQTISGGGGGGGAFSGVRVFQNVFGNVANGGVVPFDSESYDTGNYHSTVMNTSRLVAPVTGYYHINGMINANTATFIGWQIRKNGTTILANPYVGNSTSGLRANIVSDAFLNAGEYIEIVLDAAGTITTSNQGGAPSFLCMHLIGTTGAPAVAVPGLTPDLMYWLKADPILAASGSAIPYLQSYCPWMFALSAAAIGSGATRSATQLNSQNVLTFPGNANGRYNLTAGLNLSKTTIFGVFKSASFSTDQSFITGNTNSLELRTNITTGTLGLVKTGIVGIGSSTTPLAVGSWRQFNATYDSASGAYAFRIAQAAAGSGTNIQSITVNSFTIGYHSIGTLDLNGDLAELIIYNRVLTAPEITAIEAYLSAKWGV